MGRATPDVETPFLANWGSLVAIVVVLLVGSLANSAGVGGGAIFIPILQALVGFSLKDATAVSQALIAAGSVVSVIINVFKRNPLDSTQPLISFSLGLALTPVVLVGVSVGVILNQIFPSWLITILLLVLMVGLIYQAVGKSVHMWRAETRAAALHSHSMRVGQSLGVDLGSSHPLNTPLQIARSGFPATHFSASFTAVPIARRHSIDALHLTSDRGNPVRWAAMQTGAYDSLGCLEGLPETGTRPATIVPSHQKRGQLRPNNVSRSLPTRNWPQGATNSTQKGPGQQTTANNVEADSWDSMDGVQWVAPKQPACTSTQTPAVVPPSLGRGVSNLGRDEPVEGSSATGPAAARPPKPQPATRPRFTRSGSVPLSAPLRSNLLQPLLSWDVEGQRGDPSHPELQAITEDGPSGDLNNAGVSWISRRSKWRTRMFYLDGELGTAVDTAPSAFQRARSRRLSIDEKPSHMRSSPLLGQVSQQQSQQHLPQDPIGPRALHPLSGRPPPVQPPLLQADILDILSRLDVRAPSVPFLSLPAATAVFQRPPPQPRVRTQPTGPAHVFVEVQAEEQRELMLPLPASGIRTSPLASRLQNHLPVSSSQQATPFSGPVDAPTSLAAALLSEPTEATRVHGRTGTQRLSPVRVVTWTTGMLVHVAREMWEDLLLLPGWTVGGMLGTWGVFAALQVSRSLVPLCGSAYWGLLATQLAAMLGVSTVHAVFRQRPTQPQTNKRDNSSDTKHTALAQGAGLALPRLPSTAAALGARGAAIPNLPPWAGGARIANVGDPKQTPTSAARTVAAAAAATVHVRPVKASPLGNTVGAMVLTLTIATMAGLVGGLLGLGGGMVIGPLLLELGVHPQVSTATSSLMVLFSSSAALVGFIVLGRLNVQYSVVLGSVSMLASLLGVVIVGDLVRRTGRTSVVVICLACVMVIGFICIAVFNLPEMVRNLKPGGDSGFHSLC